MSCINTTLSEGLTKPEDPFPEVYSKQAKIDKVCEVIFSTLLSCYGTNELVHTNWGGYELSYWIHYLGTLQSARSPSKTLEKHFDEVYIRNDIAAAEKIAAVSYLLFFSYSFVGEEFTFPAGITDPNHPSYKGESISDLSNASSLPAPSNSSKRPKKFLRRFVFPVTQNYFEANDSLESLAEELSYQFRSNILSTLYDEASASITAKEYLLREAFDLFASELNALYKIRGKLEVRAMPSQKKEDVEVKQTGDPKIKEEDGLVRRPIIGIGESVLELFNSQYFDYDHLISHKTTLNTQLLDSFKLTCGGNEILSPRQTEKIPLPDRFKSGKVDIAFNALGHSFSVLEVKENLKPFKLKYCTKLSEDDDELNIFRSKEFDSSCLFSTKSIDMSFKKYTALSDQVTGYLQQLSCAFASLSDGMTSFFYKAELHQLNSMNGNGLRTLDDIKDMVNSKLLDLVDEIVSAGAATTTDFNVKKLEKDHCKTFNNIVNDIKILDTSLNIDEGSLIEIKKHIIVFMLNEKLYEMSGSFQTGMPDYLQTLLDGDTYAFIPFKSFAVNSSFEKPSLPIQTVLALFLYSILKDDNGAESLNLQYRVALGRLLKKKRMLLAPIEELIGIKRDRKGQEDGDGDDEDNNHPQGKKAMRSAEHLYSSTTGSTSSSISQDPKYTKKGSFSFKSTFTEYDTLLGINSETYDRLDFKALGDVIQGSNHSTLVLLTDRERLLKVFPSLLEISSCLQGKMILKVYDHYRMWIWAQEHESFISDADDVNSVVENLYSFYEIEKKIYKAIRKTTIACPKVLTCGTYQIYDKGYFLNRFGTLLLMEYIEPDTDQIEDILKSNDEIKIDNVLRDCLNLVRELNECGIRHNDLAARNFIISRGRPHLIDFQFSSFDTLEDGAIDYEVMAYEEMKSLNYTFLEMWRNLLKQENSNSITELLN